MSDQFKANLLGAKEFVPSWMNKSAAKPAAPVSSPPPAAPSTASQSKAEAPQRAGTAPPASQPAGSNGGAPPSVIPWKTPARNGVSKETTPESKPESKPAPKLSATASSYIPKAVQPSGPKLSTSSDNRPVGVNKGWARPAAGSVPAAPAASRSPAMKPAAAPAAPPVPSSTTSTANSATNSPGLKAVSYHIAKSDAEVLKTAKDSSLSKLVNAASFVPGQALKRSFAHPGKISPLLLPQSATANPEMLFGDSWCLYYLDSRAAADDDFDPTLVFRIDSIPSFWQTLNNIQPPGILHVQATLYLFRDDINPKWEDPKNSSGGMWRLKVPADRIDGVWENLCCRTVGESWQASHRNTINGIVLKVRERGYWVEVWVTEKCDEFSLDILNAVEQYYPSFNIDYLQHEEMQRKKQEALAAAAASPKSGKKKKNKY